MNVLFISNLFPNAAEPTRGVFNAQQVAALSKLCSVTVIAPTPRRLPDESRNGVTVMHPRFFHIPRLSRPFNGWLFACAIEVCVRQLNFDIAFASWAYPDAYGVMLLAKKYGFPFAADVLGSDVNAFFNNPHRKQQILTTLRASKAVFAKSKALADILAAEGISSIIDYNGIDPEKFHPLDRIECCRQLGLDPNRRRVLYVGNLVTVKGPTVLAKAFHFLVGAASPPRPGATQNRGGDAAPTVNTDLIFIGAGPERAKVTRILSALPQISDLSGLKSQVSGLRSQVFLPGSLPHSEIPLWMNACDVLCLSSLNEGLPNVAIEAMACGLPVVASRVGGVPEIVRDGVNGFMVPPSDPDALADALCRALVTEWDREAIRASVAQFNWDVNARIVLEQLRRCRHP